ncbi:protein FAM83C [Pristis pectinata]|uniref:protein FAM83C n=1 Tax=Pristis pectinata TaxID=685728 RepID=UPI00223DA16F|nr:protein FAM83C [Pristis pectinata]
MMNVNGNFDGTLFQKPTSRKPLGKLCQRLEEVKCPWRQSSALELSHSEAARLATDALLESGVSGYRRALTDERELGFLSQLEIAYISRSGAARLPGPTAELRERGSRQSLCEGDELSELTSATYFPAQTDSEAPLLDLGWAKPPRAVCLPSESQIIFQRDRSHSIKDTIRSLLNEARTLIAIVMDLFTDVDILCDLLEASNKRGVPVYLLLDESNLEHFISMCDELDIQKDHVNNMRIRSVVGDTYCTKSGKKFNGQVLEKFLIIDLEQVVAGSYSFTWLSGQVHLNFVMLLTGELTQEFDDEFRCLYAASKPIDRFSSSADEDLSYYTSKLSIAPERQIVKEKLAEPVHSNPSSSWSGSSPLSSIQAATPAAQVLWERKRTSPCASNNLPVVNRKINENDRSGNGWAGDPLTRASALGPKPNYVPGLHYVLNTRLADQAAANMQQGLVIPPRNKMPKDDLDDASTISPSSPPGRVNRGEVLYQTEAFDDYTKDLQKPLRKFTRAGNRMTLGHSKLEMMMEYNDKMRARNAFSRFQLVKHDS